MNNSYTPPVQFGNKFLDDLYPSIAYGSMILVREDEYSHHHLTFVKTFVAQNINSKITVLSKDEKKLSIPDHKKSKEMSSEDIDKMIIAWRYQNIEKQENEDKFDMGLKMDTKDKNHKFVSKNVDDVCKFV